MNITKGILYDYLQHQQGEQGGINIILASQGKKQLTEDDYKRMRSNGGPTDATGFMNKQVERLIKSYNAHGAKIKSSSYASYLQQQCVANGVDYDSVVAMVALESMGNPSISNGSYVGLFQFGVGTAKTFGVNDRTNPFQSIDGFFKYRKYNVALRQAAGINDDGSVVSQDTISAIQAEEAARIEELKRRIDLDTIGINNSNLEKHQVDVSWGSRLRSEEQSDWIGFKQYIMYLSKIFCPHILVPFAELIPKFTFEGNSKLRKQDDQQDTDIRRNADLNSDFETTRYNNMVAIYNSLRDTGGIDILTRDPFLDIANFKNERGLSFRTIGSLTYSAETDGQTVNKPGAVGVENIKIEMGDSTFQGQSVVTVVLRDQKANKFLDPASPWAFVLNRPQFGGDFLFRFGWQLQLPIESSEQNTTGYKFWNHEGWKLFNPSTVSKFKEMVKLNNGIVNFSQSINDKSLFYNGYSIEKSRNGNQLEFIKKLETDSNNTHLYYMSLNMMTPQIVFEKGSLVATLVFRTTSDMSNYMCPITNSKFTSKLIEEVAGGKVSLYDLIKAFIQDNLSYIETLEDPKQKEIYLANAKKLPEQDTAEEIKKIVQVIPVQDYNKGSSINEITLIDPKELMITITAEQIQDLKVTENNDLKLWSWLGKVLGSKENGLHQVPTTNIQSGYFNFLYDNYDSIESGTQTTFSAKQIEEVSGYLTTEGLDRLYSYDDVFAYRFQGSLVEEFDVTTAEQPTQQTIAAEQTLANSDLIATGYSALPNNTSNSGVTGNNITTIIPETNKQREKWSVRGMLGINEINNPLQNPITDYVSKINNTVQKNNAIDKGNQLINQVINMAHQYVGTQEGTAQGDLAIKTFLNSAGLPFPNSWCMSFAYYIFQKASESIGIKNPLVKTGHVLTEWRGINPNYKTTTPKVGAIYIRDKGGDSGHAGIIVAISADGKKMTTIDGNTGKPGSKGVKGVYKKDRDVSFANAGFISFGDIDPSDIVANDATQYGNVNIVDNRVQNNSLEGRRDMLKAHLSTMRNTKIKMLGHPWLQLGRTFFVKGVENFTGKYYAKKITHEITQGRFFTELEGVSSIFNDALYQEYLAQQQGETLANSTSTENISEGLPKPDPNFENRKVDRATVIPVKVGINKEKSKKIDAAIAASNKRGYMTYDEFLAIRYGVVDGDWSNVPLSQHGKAYDEYKKYKAEIDAKRNRGTAPEFNESDRFRGIGDF